MPNDKPDRCRVCGREQASPPWGDDGKSPTFEICDCCGVEFGYEDNSPESTRQYRTEWLAKGAPWFDPSAQPPDFDLHAQLAHVPAAFR